MAVSATSKTVSKPVKPKVVKPKRFEVGYSFNVPVVITSIEPDSWADGGFSYTVSIGNDEWELYEDSLDKEDITNLENSFKPNPKRDALKEKIKLAEEQLKALKAELSTTK